MKRPQLAPIRTPPLPPNGTADVVAWCAKVNENLRDIAKQIADGSATIRQLSEGHNVACGTVTLTVNVATTTVSSEGIPATAVPIFSAASANAATEIGNGTIYVSAVAKGSFTLTHANAATTARTFHWWAPVPG